MEEQLNDSCSENGGKITGKCEIIKEAILPGPVFFPSIPTSPTVSQDQVSATATKSVVKVSEAQSGSDTNGKEIKDEVPLLHPIPEKFLLPELVQIADWVDSIVENEIDSCVAIHIVNPSEIYLAFTTEFPLELDHFMREMTNFYNRAWQTLHRYRLMVEPERLKIGCYCAVLFNNVEMERREWGRGKLTGHNTDGDPETEYEFFLIDLGIMCRAGLGDIAFLHEDYIDNQAFTLKCRFALSSYYDKYHKRIERWPISINEKFLDALYTYSFKTRFIRQLEDNGAKIWEMSIVEFEDEHPDFPKEQPMPIEQQIIKKVMGFYADEVEKPGPAV